MEKRGWPRFGSGMVARRQISAALATSQQFLPDKIARHRICAKDRVRNDAERYQDSRNLNSIAFGDFIDRYAMEIVAVRPFGKNKAAVLKTVNAALGAVPLLGLSADRLHQYVGKGVPAARAA